MTLRLEGLGPTELADLGSATGHPLSRRAAQRLCTHTGGNPLHARALLEELADSALEDDAADLPAPRSFAMVVAARLASCTPETVNLVQAAAVLGQRCSLGTAAAVGRVPDPAEALDDAVAAHLLDFCPPCHVMFVHPLVRAAVYGDLGPSRRVDLHARAAAALDGSAALFHRVEGALVEDAALALDVEAHARHELARGAMTAGADALLAAARLTPDPSLRSTLVFDALEALVAAGEVARAAMVANELPAAADSARGSYFLGHLALFCGRQDEAETLLVETWSRWDPCQQPGLGPLVAAAMSQVCAILVVLERLMGTNDLVGAGFLARGASAARSVARIVIRSGPELVDGFGTGFLVAPGLLMTNHHVLGDPATALHSEAEFDFQLGPGSGPGTATLRPPHLGRPPEHPPPRRQCQRRPRQDPHRALDRVDSRAHRTPQRVHVQRVRRPRQRLRLREPCGAADPGKP